MKVLILGATGMVGGEVLEQCLANEKIQRVLTIGRRKSGIENPKLKEVGHGDFLDYSTVEAELKNVDPGFPRWIIILMTFLRDSAIRINAIPSSRRASPVSPGG